MNEETTDRSNANATYKKYDDMVRYLLIEKREVKVIDHKFVVRVTPENGRLRGLSVNIFRACLAYREGTLSPGDFLQHVEQAKIQIRDMLDMSSKPSNSSSKAVRTTMMTLDYEGFLDSNPSLPTAFNDEDFLTDTEKCLHYWRNHPEEAIQLQSILKNRGLPDQLIQQAFAQTTDTKAIYAYADKVFGRFSSAVDDRMFPSHDTHSYNQLESDDDTDDSDEYSTIVIKEEDVKALHGMFPSHREEEIRAALQANHGRVDLAADDLLK